MNLNNINKQLKTQSEFQAKQRLEREGRRLERIALKLWRQYLSSYSPKEYRRTGKAERGIKLGRVKKINAFQYGIELEYENDLMYHDSEIGSSKKGHAVMLISDGWYAKKLEARRGRVYRFTYFEGTGYLKKVYDEFYRSMPAGMDLDVNWSGKAYKG